MKQSALLQFCRVGLSALLLSFLFSGCDQMEKKAMERGAYWDSLDEIRLQVGESRELFGARSPEAKLFDWIPVVLDPEIAEVRADPWEKDGARVSAEAGAASLRALKPGRTELAFVSHYIYLPEASYVARDDALIQPGLRRQLIESQLESLRKEVPEHDNFPAEEADLEAKWRFLMHYWADLIIPLVVEAEE